jgi:hypothetical protein
MIVPQRSIQKSTGIILVYVVIAVFMFHINNQLVSKEIFIFGFFHESQSQSMLTHTDNKFYFTVNYPSNWEKSVKINNEIIFIAPKDQDSVSSPADSASKQLVSEIQKEHKDFKMETSETSTVDGKKAVKVIFTATDSKLQNRKAIQIVFSNYENIYILTYKASLDKYNTFESTANDIIKSFKFLPRL